MTIRLGDSKTSKHGRKIVAYVVLIFLGGVGWGGVEKGVILKNSRGKLLLCFTFRRTGAIHFKRFC